MKIYEKVEKCLSLGGIEFVNVGNFDRKQNGKVTIIKEDAYRADWAEKKGVIYAFVNRTNNELMYIGMSVRTMNARVSGHRNAANNSKKKTDNYMKLVECIDQCDIYAHFPSYIEYGDMMVQPVESVESALIQKYNPPANTKIIPEEE